MAAADWMEIYRSYEAAELTTEIADLKTALKGSLSAQASGSVNQGRDLQQLEHRLKAATRVKKEKAGTTGEDRHGVVDFSGTGLEDF